MQLVKAVLGMFGVLRLSCSYSTTGTIPSKMWEGYLWKNSGSGVSHWAGCPPKRERKREFSGEKV